MSPHAAEWRSLQLLVAVCRILSTLRALSSLRSLARCARHTIMQHLRVSVYLCVFGRVCMYLRVFARMCVYLLVFARICAYLRVSASICEYLPEFACIFVCLCAFLLVSARICTHSQELLKIISKCSKKQSQKAPKNFSKRHRPGNWLQERLGRLLARF